MVLQRSDKIRSGKDLLHLASKTIDHQQEWFQGVLEAEARLKRGWGEGGGRSKDSKCDS